MKVHKKYTKILIIIEDYNERTYFENTLIKIGFDILSITNERTIEEKMFSFNPNLILLSTLENKFILHEIIKKIKKSLTNKNISLIIIKNEYNQKNYNKNELLKDKKIFILNKPLTKELFFKTLSSITQHNYEELINKLDKIYNAKINEKEKAIFVKHNLIKDDEDQDSTNKGKTKERINKYKNIFLNKKAKSNQSHFLINSGHKMLKKDQSTVDFNNKQNKITDQEKQNFVIKMFQISKK